MCRPSCIWPQWHDLPKERFGLPVVHGIPMDEDEYRISGWHSRGTYPSAKGTNEHQWIAPTDRLQEWSRREWRMREDRIAAAQTRRAAEDDYSDQVVAGIERGGNR
jgi:hypothetical protein